MIVACLLFAVLRRRIGPLLALGSALVILFFGSAPDVVLAPIGIAQVYSTAAGLGALLMLERGDRRGDVAACALLTAAVATFSTGLAVLAGVGVWLLLDRRRRSRIWVAAIPLAIYAAWFVWALQFDQGGLSSSNLTLIPRYVSDGLAASLRAITGLSYFEVTDLTLTVSRVLAAAVVLALAYVLFKGPRRVTLLALIAVPVAFWVSIALAADVTRTPDQSRFLFFASVAVMIVLAEAARRTRLPTRAIVLIAGLLMLSLAANVTQLREAGANLRTVSAQTQAVLGVYEIVGPSASPSYNIPFLVGVPAGTYLRGAERNGAYGFSIEEIQGQPLGIRVLADRTLVGALGIAATATAPPEGGCARRRADGPMGLPLPAGGAVLRSQEPGSIQIGRFADVPAQAVGALPGEGKAVLLEIPVDRSTAPWRLSFGGPGPIVVCPLGSLPAPQ